MAFHSVEAAVHGRHDGGDHFVLAASQGQLRIQQDSVGRHGMPHGLGNEAMSGRDAVGAAVLPLDGCHFSHVFGRIQAVNRFVTFLCDMLSHKLFPSPWMGEG